MDFDSPDVAKEFPGLYASESSGSRKNKDESEFSDSDHKKEQLIGRLKDKKDKKDRGYAALNSSEEEESKSPSKSSKKIKAFKFPTKSKEKREKSRDKEKPEKEIRDSNTLDKKKEKEKKEKKEKVKDKDKDKKEKKSKQTSVNSEEILDLGDAQPIFGVSLGLAVERSRCHDNINLPLVVRDCIDYIQEHGLGTDQVYKIDTIKGRLQQLKKLYNHRESNGTDDFDVATACCLLKLFLQELPEPILTTDLLARFEEAAALSQITQQEMEMNSLIDQLPSCNKTLLSWMILHLDEITQNEKYNKMNAQNVAILLSPALQMSHRLLLAFLCHCKYLFPDTLLLQYIPPITASSPNFPETPDEITNELKKQESLLNQIHSEMNAGFVTKKREEQLWEVQRIITQLKRKLRSFEKKQDSTQKSLDDTVDGDLSMDLNIQKAKSICSDDELSCKTVTIVSTSENTETKTTPQDNFDDCTVGDEIIEEIQQIDELEDPDKYFLSDSGLLMLPENHPEYFNLIRIQLEHQELVEWKLKLQARINSERSELFRLKKILGDDVGGGKTQERIIEVSEEADYERIISHYMKENYLLEQKKNMLAKEIFEENTSLIDLQVFLEMKKFRT